MQGLSFVPIPGFVDNYFWLLHDGRYAVVVDPGDARPVTSALRERDLRLTAILVTHHHPDHVGGLPGLLRERNVPVFGPRAESASIPLLSTLLAEGDRVTLTEPRLDLEIWEVPGHTLGHIAYVSREPRFVLCGDTLFAAGCGRLFEGTPEQMHRSLERLRALPEDTEVYCTHEYTQANLAFARVVEPGNEELRMECERVDGLRKRGQPSLPSNIGRERAVNPFLRCQIDDVVAAAGRKAGKPLQAGEDVFAVLRHWKDGFRG